MFYYASFCKYLSVDEVVYDIKRLPGIINPYISYPRFNRYT
jgi:hypothetical protein